MQVGRRYFRNWTIDLPERAYADASRSLNPVWGEPASVLRLHVRGCRCAQPAASTTGDKSVWRKFASRRCQKFTNLFLPYDEFAPSFPFDSLHFLHGRIDDDFVEMRLLGHMQYEVIANERDEECARDMNDKEYDEIHEPYRPPEEERVQKAEQTVEVTNTE